MTRPGDPLANDGALNAFYRLLVGDDIADATARVTAVADFSLSREDQRPFVAFIEWINTRPGFIADWRADEISERREYLRFMSGLESARDGYAASVYHLERLREIEEAVHEILGCYDFSKSLPRGSVAGIGNTRKWGFEYQAFVLAYRGALDRLAWGLSTYFKANQSSFRQFTKSLPKHHPAPVAVALSEACARHVAQFDFVMGTERGRSVRDRIAHREAVQAGFVNVGAFGHRIVGGGEELNLTGSDDQMRLADRLQARLRCLHACIADMLATFQEAVTAHEAGDVA